MHKKDLNEKNSDIIRHESSESSEEEILLKA